MVKQNVQNQFPFFKHTMQSSSKLMTDQPMITQHCITISSSTLFTKSWGRVCYIFTRSQWKTNAMLRNKNVNSVSHIICMHFIKSFISLSGWVSRCYVGQLLQYQLSHIYAYWHGGVSIQNGGFRTAWQISPPHVNSGLALPWSQAWLLAWTNTQIYPISGFIVTWSPKYPLLSNYSLVKEDAT